MSDRPKLDAIDGAFRRLVFPYLYYGHDDIREQFEVASDETLILKIEYEPGPRPASVLTAVTQDKKHTDPGAKDKDFFSTRYPTPSVEDIYEDGEYKSFSDMSLLVTEREFISGTVIVSYILSLVRAPDCPTDWILFPAYNIKQILKDEDVEAYASTFADLSDKRLWLFPLNIEDKHWVLVAVHRWQRHVLVYDSYPPQKHRYEINDDIRIQFAKRIKAHAAAALFEPEEAWACGIAAVDRQVKMDNNSALHTAVNAACLIAGVPPHQSRLGDPDNESAMREWMYLYMEAVIAFNLTTPTD